MRRIVKRAKGHRHSFESRLVLNYFLYLNELLVVIHICKSFIDKSASNC
jgi:hypothetical protein